MTTVYNALGALIADPRTDYNADADQKRREVRQGLYDEAPSNQFEGSPFAKYMLRSSGKPVANTKFEFGMRKYDPNYATCLGAFTDSACTTPVSSGTTAAGTTIYLKFSKDDYPYFIVDEARMLAIKEDYTKLTVGVAAVDLIDDTTDYTRVTVKTLMVDAGVLNAIGDEGKTCEAIMLATARGTLSDLPESFYREPVVCENYTQIFMDACSISGTEANAENIFGLDVVADMEKIMLERFNTRFDRTAWWGQKNDGTGTAAVTRYGVAPTTRKRSTGGLWWALKTYEPSNVFTIPGTTTYNGTTYTGTTWAQNGWDFMGNFAEVVGKYSVNQELDLWCGVRAFQAIQDLMEAQTSVEITPFTKDEWGFRIRKIHGLTATFNLHLHKDWSIIPSLQHCMACIDPAGCHYVPYQGRDLTYVADMKQQNTNGWTWVDGMKSGWMMEGGFAWERLSSMAIVDGVGQNFAAA